MTGSGLVVRLRNDLSELERIAGVVERFGSEHGLPGKAVFEINLALDEVLTNVISYAYDDGGQHEIEVRLSIPGEDVMVEVSDDGRPFDPLAVAPAELDQPLDERRIGGLGVHLVRRVMDRLEYRRDAGRNVLTMHKRAGAAP